MIDELDSNEISIDVSEHFNRVRQLMRIEENMMVLYVLHPDWELRVRNFRLRDSEESEDEFCDCTILGQ
jgi:hypothetical protein